MSSNELPLPIQAGPRKIVVTPIELPKSAIYTGADEESDTQGTIIDVGCYVDGTWIGREVIFKKFAGVNFELQGQKYIVLTEDDILVTLA